MEVGAGAIPTDPDEEYLQFFRSLGIMDNSKVAFLARMLEAFYNMAIKLDEHLAPTGAVLHAAISRMCQGDSPMDAPQHRWIRIQDRLGFFSDGEDHGSRVINMGLAFAYRHKELEALSEANTLQLENLRIAAARANRTPVAAGGLSHAAACAATQVGANVAEDDADPAAGHGGDDGDGSIIPEGGLVLRRDQPRGVAGGDAAGEDAAGGCDADGLPNEGGLVVHRRDPPPPVSNTDDPAAASLVEVAGDTAKRTEVKSQPTVNPSAEAVVAVKAVLEKMLVRSDCKDVLRKMLMDGLVTLTRLHSGQSTNPGVISATDAEPDWSSVRNLLTEWWPSWSLPRGAAPVLPVAGTAAFSLHPTRPTCSSKWIVTVDMTSINPVIDRVSVKTLRYFKPNNLADTIDVVRIAPSLKPPLATTIACMLLVGTWEPSFCFILTQMASDGRAPVVGTVPLEAAACHNFETDGLADAVALLPTSEDGGGADVVDMGTSAALPARPRSELLAERQSEVDVLLAADKAKNATLRRAYRRDVRRRGGPPVHGAHPTAAHQADAPPPPAVPPEEPQAAPPVALSAAPPAARPARSRGKRPPPSTKTAAEPQGDAHKRPRGDPPADGGALSTSQVTAPPSTADGRAPLEDRSTRDRAPISLPRAAAPPEPCASIGVNMHLGLSPDGSSVARGGVSFVSPSVDSAAGSLSLTPLLSLDGTVAGTDGTPAPRTLPGAGPISRSSPSASLNPVPLPSGTGLQSLDGDIDVPALDDKDGDGPAGPD